MASSPTVNDMMAVYALDAVDHARASSGIELDFSTESVRDVETILGVMFDSRPRGILARLVRRGPSAEMVATVARMYGGYVGEVLRRHRGGEWYLDTETAPGRAVIELRKGDSRLWPPAKVEKRLTNGPEDDVWRYLQVILQEPW